MNKYSAAYWGTSFVREMTRIELPNSDPKPVAESPSDSTPDTPVQKNNTLPHPTVEELKGGQAELHLKKDELRGTVLSENGTVPPTPAQNALAPHNSA